MALGRPTNIIPAARAASLPLQSENVAVVPSRLDLSFSDVLSLASSEAIIGYGKT
jgi:hypothetical protein